MVIVHSSGASVSHPIWCWRFWFWQVSLSVPNLVCQNAKIQENAQATYAAIKKNIVTRLKLTFYAEINVLKALILESLYQVINRFFPVFKWTVYKLKTFFEHGTCNIRIIVAYDIVIVEVRVYLHTKYFSLRHRFWPRTTWTHLLWAVR